MTAPRPSIPSDPTAPSAPAPASPAPSNPAASTSASSTPALSTPVPSTPAPSAPPAPAATALEALAASEERYRLALEANDEGAWDWDLAAGAVLVNDRAYTLLGYAPGEVQATYDLWRRCLHPEDAPRVERALSAYLAGESPDYRSEHRVVIKSGEIRWHRVTGKVVSRAADGTPRRLIGVMQDITDQKGREMRLQETLDLLRLALDTADIGLWSWDLESGKLEWDDRLCHWYGVPEETRATGLYYDFWQNRLHPVNPRTVPRECLTDLAPLATAKGLTLQLTIAPGVPTGVLLDPLRLQQILNNLLINSVKFTRRGEIHLEVGAQPAAPGRIGLWFRVMDTGPGITPADQERLFEPFFQSLTGEDVPASFRGHGVGLPLSRELARAMAGELRVESGPEGGSRFTLILPSVPLAEEGDSAHSPVDTARAHPAEDQPEAPVAGQDPSADRPATRGPGEVVTAARRGPPPEPERRPEHRPPCQAELQPERQQWTPATAKPPEDLVAPPAEALTELRELAIRGLNQRIRAWCRHGSIPERQPAFAARVMHLATQFDHASILALVDAALDAAPARTAPAAGTREPTMERPKVSPPSPAAEGSSSLPPPPAREPDRESERDPRVVEILGLPRGGGKFRPFV